MTTLLLALVILSVLIRFGFGAHPLKTAVIKRVDLLVVMDLGFKVAQEVSHLLPPHVVEAINRLDVTAVYANVADLFDPRAAVGGLLLATLAPQIVKHVRQPRLCPTRQRDPKITEVL